MKKLILTLFILSLSLTLLLAATSYDIGDGKFLVLNDDVTYTIP